jgi:sialic acid synthase SpsE
VKIRSRPSLSVRKFEAVWKTVLGTCVIEKHVTLSRADGGPDAAFSLEPSEMKGLVDSVRNVEKALGEVVSGASEHEVIGLKS